MKLGPWFVSLPTEAGKYAKQAPGMKYPDLVSVVGDADGVLREFNNGKFWELREGASWAKVEEI